MTLSSGKLSRALWRVWQHPWPLSTRCRESCPAVTTRHRQSSPGLEDATWLCLRATGLDLCLCSVWRVLSLCPLQAFKSFCSWLEKGEVELQRGCSVPTRVVGMKRWKVLARCGVSWNPIRCWQQNARLCLVTQLCLTLCSLLTIAHQALLSMGFPRQEYWSGCPFLLQGNLPDVGIESVSPAISALTGGFFTTQPPGKQASKLAQMLGKLFDSIYLNWTYACCKT